MKARLSGAKKWLLFMTAVAMLAGCSGGGSGSPGGSSASGSDGTGSSSGGTKETNGAQSGNAAAEPMEMWYRTTEGDKIVDNAYATKRLEELYNIRIHWESIQSDTYRDQLVLAIASGKTPDYLVDQNFSDFEKFVGEGVVAAIPEQMIETYAPKYVAWLKKHLGDDPFVYARRDGNIYSLPIIWTLGATSDVIGIRQDWLRKVGIGETPETIGEVEAALDKFRNGDPDGNGQKDTYGMTASAADLKSMFSSVFGAFGVYPGAFIGQDGSIVRGEIEPGAKEALALLNKWYKNEWIDPEFIVNKSSNVADKVISGKVGIVQRSWFAFIPNLAFYKGEFYEPIPNVEWALIAGPVGPNGDQGLLQSNPVVNSGMQFGKHMERQPEKMQKYLEVIDGYNFDIDVRADVLYGIKGETYEITAEGDYRYLPPYDDEKKRIEYGVGTPYAITHHFNDYELQTPFMTAGVYRDVRAAAEKVGKGKYDILQPLVKPVFNEYNDRLNQFAIKNFIDFISGKRPIDEFDAYVQEWLGMGGDKVMAEAQQMYDTYLK